MRDRANRIKLLSIGTAQIRAFHLTSMAFVACFFACFSCGAMDASDEE